MSSLPTHHMFNMHIEHTVFHTEVSFQMTISFCVFYVSRNSAYPWHNRCYWSTSIFDRHSRTWCAMLITLFPLSLSSSAMGQYTSSI